MERKRSKNDQKQESQQKKLSEIKRSRNITIDGAKAYKPDDDEVCIKDGKCMMSNAKRQEDIMETNSSIKTEGGKEEAKRKTN